jgi:hypothetical protein
MAKDLTSGFNKGDNAVANTHMNKTPTALRECKLNLIFLKKHIYQNG